MKREKFAPGINPRFKLHIRVTIMKQCPYCQSLGQAIDGYWHHFRCNLTGLEGQDSCGFKNDWAFCYLNSEKGSKNNYRDEKSFKWKFREKREVKDDKSK